MLDSSLFSYAALLSLAQIIGVNIVLSGDNAVVIALAARSLPPSQQKKAIVWGSVAAIIMRIILTFAAVALLQSPYLRLVGAIVLLWIGVKLLDTNESEEGDEIESSSNVMAAVRTILIADLVMSLDNVLAVAAASMGNDVLLIIGLATSIPLVVFGAKMLIRLIGRFPIIITVGGALIGYVAGEMAVTDIAVKDWVDANMHALHYVAPISAAILTLAIGKIMNMRGRTASAPTPEAERMQATGSFDEHEGAAKS